MFKAVAGLFTSIKWGIVVRILGLVCVSTLNIRSCPSFASESEHFNPDDDVDRINWSQLYNVLGPPPNVRGQRFGIVIKTLTNEYWRLMTLGYRRRAAADGVKLDVQAAQTENDPIRQLTSLEIMIGGGNTALLISPQSALNLRPAINDAMIAKIPVVDVDGAVVDNVEHFVGAVNRDMGVRVADWFISHFPDGGKLAVIEGQAGVYSTVQRSSGFRETAEASHKFKVVSALPGNWERRQAYDAALDVLAREPDLIGIYCNNDTMALGVVDAAKKAKVLRKVRIFGNDGTEGAYTSIKAGELTGTVDIFPSLTGEIGLDIAERLSVGQVTPRVVETPQALVTIENVSHFEGGFASVRDLLVVDTLKSEARLGLK